MEIYQEINGFLEFCAENESSKSVVISECIDGSLSKLAKNSEILTKSKDEFFREDPDTDIAFTPFIYEIGGNLKYMHCS